MGVSAGSTLPSLPMTHRARAASSVAFVLGVPALVLAQSVTPIVRVRPRTTVTIPPAVRPPPTRTTPAPAPAPTTPPAAPQPQPAPAPAPAPAPTPPPAPTTTTLAVPGFTAVTVPTDPSRLPVCNGAFGSTAHAPGDQCRGANGAVVTRVSRAGDATEYWHVALAGTAAVWSPSVEEPAGSGVAWRAVQSAASERCTALGARLPSREDYGTADGAGLFAVLRNVSGTGLSPAWTSTLRGESSGSSLAVSYGAADPRRGGGASSTSDSVVTQRFEVRCVR